MNLALTTLRLIGVPLNTVNPWAVGIQKLTLHNCRITLKFMSLMDGLFVYRILIIKN